MDENKLKKPSRYLTLLLRHSPEKEQLTMNVEGYVPVSEIYSKLKLTPEELEWIVSNDNKSRFKFNYNKTLIRASQGHSLPWVKLQYESRIPPKVLYHGTSYKNYETILKSGHINKMDRQYVHLSSDLNTANAVGSRHGTPIIINIDTEEMVKDDITFYLSDNEVWLTEIVSTKYFK